MRSVGLRYALAACVLALAGTGANLGTSAAAGTPSQAAEPGSRPNVLLITTDDQNLTDLQTMPRTRRLLAERGMSFQGLSPHPLCCPARAEILTGQYAQNNGVRTNKGRYGGYHRLDTSSTIATWLDDAGYITIFMGKFLNQYDAKDTGDATPGWDSWNATARRIYNYNDFAVNHNGSLRSYHAYQTDFFGALGRQKIRDVAGRSQPFFLWQSFVAPHTTCCWTPPVPAKRHATMFPSALPPSLSDPSYNEADVADKPSFIRKLSPLSSRETKRIVRLHRERIRSLQAVDEQIGRTVRTLARLGELDNTLIIFTSDNGFLLGEHRYSGKVLAYEPAVRVPLLMRGPNIPAGAVSDEVATTVDIAPTIAAAAGATPTITVDGQNLLPVAAGSAGTRGNVLIQAGPRTDADEPFGWFYRGVRTFRYTYAYYPRTGERELYDRKLDPHQLESVADDQRYREVESALHQRMLQLKDCKGTQCQASFPPLPAPG